MPNRKTRVVTFAVTRQRSLSVFPIDMLRYDQCFPLGSADVNLIDSCARHSPDAPAEPTIWLQHTCHPSLKLFRPTGARWESFGWTVIAIRDL